jgi:hypothetical protein
VSVINRRNAILGWAVWSVGKRVGKKKLRAAAPSVEDGKPNASLIASLVAGAVAAAAGATAFVRARRNAKDDD